MIQLIGAIFDVNFEMFGCVFQEDVANFTDEDVLLPTLFQVGKKSFRAFTDRYNVGEKSVTF